MFKKSNKNFQLLTLFFVLVNILILSILSIISWTYLTGYLVGVVISISGFFLNIFFSEKLLTKKRSMKMGFVISICKFLLWMLITGSIIIGVLFINHSYQKSNDTTSWIDGIFNIFLLIYGASTIAISLIINAIFESVIKKRKKGGV